MRQFAALSWSKDTKHMTWGVLGFDFNLCAFSHTAKMGLSLKKGGGTELLNMGANSQ